MAMRKTTLALFAALLLSACASAPPPPQGSKIDAEPQWIHLPLTTEATNAPLTADPRATVEHDWWRAFGDPTLDALIAEALSNNKTLAVAKARVEEARANRASARSRLFPEINAAASASRGNQGFLT